MRKYAPEVFVAMRRGGLSNRRIAALLGVNESTVRRGLAKASTFTTNRTVSTVLRELADMVA
jgi:transposase